MGLAAKLTRREAQFIQSKRLVDAPMQRVAHSSVTRFPQLHSQLIAGEGKDSLGQKKATRERGESSPYLLLCGALIFDECNPFGKRCKRLGLLCALAHLTRA